MSAQERRNVSADLEKIGEAQTRLQYAVQAVRATARGSSMSGDDAATIKAQVSRVANTSARLYAAMANYFVEILQAGDTDLRGNDDNRAAMDDIVNRTSETTDSICELTSDLATSDSFLTVSAESSLAWGCGTDLASETKQDKAKQRTYFLYEATRQGTNAQPGPPATTAFSPSFFADALPERDLSVNSPIDAVRSTSVQAPFALIASSKSVNGLEDAVRASSSWPSPLTTSIHNQLMRQTATRVKVSARLHSTPDRRRLSSDATNKQESSLAPLLSTVLLLPFGANHGADPREAKGFSSSEAGVWRRLLMRSITSAQTSSSTFFTG